MRPASRALLEDLLRTLDTIAAFIEGQTFGDYESNVMLRHATEGDLIAIGEILLGLKAHDSKTP